MSTARPVTTVVDGVTFVTETFTPTAAQTLFTLSQDVATGGRIDLWINGIAMVEGTHFDRGPAANEITWKDVPFTLETTDCLMVTVQTSA